MKQDTHFVFPRIHNQIDFEATLLTFLVCVCDLRRVNFVHYLFCIIFHQIHNYESEQVGKLERNFSRGFGRNDNVYKNQRKEKNHLCIPISNDD